MDKHTYLGNADPAQVDELYRLYRDNPESVDFGWQKFFEGFDFFAASGKPGVSAAEGIPDEFKVINLINAYRQRGHLFTLTNPVRTRRKYLPTLDLVNFGLQESDLNREFEAGKEIGIGKSSLRNIIDHLNQTYCQSIGVEFAYIRNEEIVKWLKSRMEGDKNTPAFNKREKLHILQKLSEAVLFEKFIHKKFPGQKRFSLEGSESLIPALDAVIERGAGLGESEFIIGMPHRGRLSVLANILQKPPHEIFTEFQGKEYDDRFLMGDVKYHLGYTSERKSANNQSVRLSLSPNPSHLETVSAVVEGIARARIDQVYNGHYGKITPILIHGDASIAGQVIVYEVLQMSELPVYHTGGTIHMVVNNQVGFTTNYLDARSSVYCTDIAKIIQSPIFHVNADDVEAVVYAVQLAMEFREKFHKDVFIDLLGYRKYGHNEGDEPKFTQPVLYNIIEKHPDPKEIYVSRLLREKSITQEEAKAVETQIMEMLEKNLEEALQSEKAFIPNFLESSWEHIRRATASDFEKSPETGVSADLLKNITERMTSLPTDRKFFRKITRLLQERRDMVFTTDKIDWAVAELLAYGSLITEGHSVRISGQDVQRGTFSHRHAVLTVEDTNEYYTPLKHLSENQAPFEIYNSLLSEYGVLGFEYGYSIAMPDSLVIWEAQFGDFSNGAQIIFDQYISSAEDKWRVMSGLVVLLPHGYEGQGPEHSSARLERFLTLCADGNMQIANCTTPANFFHLLRRQLHREFRKPLIVFTPKSLLRHESCVSPLKDLAEGHFQEVIQDTAIPAGNVKRLVFCSGKIYYDLIEERERTANTTTAIVRIEQLYPFPASQLRAVIKSYPHVERYLWVQEEPANMGAWSFLKRQFTDVEMLLIARPESGSPATGNPGLHKQRQRKIIEKAFGECECGRVYEVVRMLCATKEGNYSSTK